ncbi:TniQ family protein [Bosea sp. UC22_33]|uniref:TniQ family protein n=1 Tax=Bosea sp. UC22_33 TaxID=3350165 RepID=UPI00366B8746
MASSRKPPRLSNRTGDYGDEPLMALVNRRAVQIGMENIAKLWGALGGLPPHSKPYPQIFSAVTRLSAAKTAGRVFWATPQAGGQRIQLMGNTYRPEQIDRTNIRWCAHCLKSEPYFRAMWTIKAYTNCAVHGVALRSSCDGCGKMQRWPRSGAPHNITVCGCGERLDRVATEIPEASSCTNIDRWLFKNAPAAISLYRKRTWTDDLLTDGMPYNQVLECFSRLGAYDLAPAAPFQDTADKTQQSDLMSRGLECASSDGFFALLSRVSGTFKADDAACADATPRQRLITKYGQLAAWLLSRRSSAPFEILIDTLLYHNRVSDVIDHPNQTFSYITQGEFVTLDEISQNTTIKIDSLWDKLQYFGYIIPIDMPGSFKIPKHVLDRLLSEPADAYLSYKDLAASLNVAADFARDLLLEGCISEDPKQAATRQIVVKKIQVDELLLRLEARYQAGRENDALVPVLKARTPFSSRTGLIKMILDGKLPIRQIARGRRGLDRYLLAPDEIERIFLAEKRAIKMREAIRLLAMNEGEIKILISQGHISATMVGGQRLLDNSDVNACLRSFVGERKAMKELRASRSLLAKAASDLREPGNILLRDGDHIVFTRSGFERIRSLLNTRFGTQLKLAI